VDGDPGQLPPFRQQQLTLELGQDGAGKINGGPVNTSMYGKADQRFYILLENHIQLHDGDALGEIPPLGFVVSADWY